MISSSHKSSKAAPSGPIASSLKGRVSAFVSDINAFRGHKALHLSRPYLCVRCALGTTTFKATAVSATGTGGGRFAFDAYATYILDGSQPYLTFELCNKSLIGSDDVIGRCSIALTTDSLSMHGLRHQLPLSGTNKGITGFVTVTIKFPYHDDPSKHAATPNAATQQHSASRSSPSPSPVGAVGVIPEWRQAQIERHRRELLPEAEQQRLQRQDDKPGHYHRHNPPAPAAGAVEEVEGVPNRTQRQELMPEWPHAAPPVRAAPAPAPAHVPECDVRSAPPPSYGSSVNAPPMPYATGVGHATAYAPAPAPMPVAAPAPMPSYGVGGSPYANVPLHGEGAAAVPVSGDGPAARGRPTRPGRSPVSQHLPIGDVSAFVATALAEPLKRDTLVRGPYGGSGGAPFGADQCYTVWGAPTAVRVRFAAKAAAVLGIDLVFGAHGVSANGAPADSVSAKVQREAEFDWAADDCIVSVDVWARDNVNAVRFHTRSGAKSPIYGENVGGASPTVVAGGHGRALVAIAGAASVQLDSVSFVFEALA